MYDFAAQVREPLDRLVLADLPGDHAALTFLLREPRPPVFRSDRVAITREAAAHLAGLFDLLVARGIDRNLARQFTLRSVHALFAAGLGLTPSDRLEPESLASIELSREEQDLLARAADLDWSRCSSRCSAISSNRDGPRPPPRSRGPLHQRGRHPAAGPAEPRPPLARAHHRRRFF
ncbi:hypothetical protein [Nannocystis pusilla]|uniref:hypothetical protein n=1 Tax=Nannocystis pusilla TaxID=889268 RepID=UPI003B7AC174